MRSRPSSRRARPLWKGTSTSQAASGPLATLARSTTTRPVILDVDTARMVASGNTVWHAGVTVYLAESVDPEFLSITDPDNPEMQILTGMWDEEE